MERKFLEDLGIAKEVIDKVMEEHGKSVQEEQDKTKSKDAELSATKKTLEELQGKVKEFEGKDPKEMEKALTDLQKQHEGELSKLKLNSALELALAKSKAKRPEAVQALLDMDAIKLDGDKLLGFDDQITKLKESDAYLFEDDKTVANRKDSGREHGSAASAEKDAVLIAALREGAGLPLKKQN